MEYLLYGIIGLLVLDIFREYRESRAGWREVASGEASIFALRMLTGMTDREELTARFGEPGPTFRYKVSPEQVRAARTGARRFFDKRTIELSLYGIAVIAGLAAAFQGSPRVGLAIVATTFLYQAIKSGYGLLLLIRSHRQRYEEGRIKFEIAKNQAS